MSVLKCDRVSILAILLMLTQDPREWTCACQRPSWWWEFQYVYQLVPNIGLLNRWRINLGLFCWTNTGFPVNPPPPHVFSAMHGSQPASAHTPPFTLGWEYSFHSMSFYSFAVQNEPLSTPTLTPAVPLFPWMPCEIIESAQYVAGSGRAPTSSCLVNTVSLKSAP